VSKLLRIAFWSAAVFAFVMATLPQPPQVPGSPPDKVLHILAFACLAVLGSTAYPRLSALKLIAALSSFGAVIEGVQLIPRLHRDAEILDWVADTGAAIAVVLAIHVWRRTYLGIRQRAAKNP
jgi:VanZ family protein